MGFCDLKRRGHGLGKIVPLQKRSQQPLVDETRDGLAQAGKNGFSPPLFDHLECLNQAFEFTILRESPVLKVDHDSAHSEGVAFFAEYLDRHLGFLGPSEGEHHDGAPYVDGFVGGIECEMVGLDRFRAGMCPIDWLWGQSDGRRFGVVRSHSKMNFSFKGAKAAARASARDAFDFDGHQVPVVEPGEPGRGVAGAQ